MVVKAFAVDTPTSFWSTHLVGRNKEECWGYSPAEEESEEESINDISLFLQVWHTAPSPRPHAEPHQGLYLW